MTKLRKTIVAGTAAIILAGGTVVAQQSQQESQAQSEQSETPQKQTAITWLWQQNQALSNKNIDTFNQCKGFKPTTRSAHHLHNDMWRTGVEGVELMGLMIDLSIHHDDEFTADDAGHVWAMITLYAEWQTQAVQYGRPNLQCTPKKPPPTTTTTIPDNPPQ